MNTEAIEKAETPGWWEIRCTILMLFGTTSVHASDPVAPLGYLGAQLGAVLAVLYLVVWWISRQLADQEHGRAIRIVVFLVFAIPVWLLMAGVWGIGAGTWPIALVAAIFWILGFLPMKKRPADRPSPKVGNPHRRI